MFRGQAWDSAQLLLVMEGGSSSSTGPPPPPPPPHGRPVPMALQGAAPKSRTRPFQRLSAQNIPIGRTRDEQDTNLYRWPFRRDGDESDKCRYFNMANGCRRGRTCKWLHICDLNGGIWPSKYHSPMVIYASVSTVLRMYILGHFDVPYFIWFQKGRFLPRTTTIVGNAFRNEIRHQTWAFPDECLECISDFVESHLRRPQFPPMQVLSTAFRNYPEHPNVQVEVQLNCAGNFISAASRHYMATGRASPQVRLHRGEIPHEAHAMQGACERTADGGYLLYHGTTMVAALWIICSGLIKESRDHSPIGVYAFPKASSCDYYNQGALFAIEAHGITLSQKHSAWLRTANERVPVGCIAHFSNRSQNHECVMSFSSFRVLSVRMSYMMLRQVLCSVAKYRHFTAGLPIVT